MAMACVRWSWKFVAWAKTSAVVSRASGCMTSSRLAAERAMSAPVRRVNRPLKSSGPVGVSASRELVMQLLFDPIHEFGRGQTVDDDGALRRHRFGHRLRRVRRGQVRKCHRDLLSPSVSIAPDH
jgi:hypothetical protein